MKDIKIAITAASYSGNKGAAAMLQSSIGQLYDIYGESLNINLMSVYPKEDQLQLPYDFIKVVSAKPEQVLFLVFPLAILYKCLKFISPVKKLLEKNKIIKNYIETDLVIDEAGISFVDSRGVIMNLYAFVCIAIPMLLGIPVVKYSQAMGSFHSPANRLLAKIVLPKLKLICARGEKTYENLQSIGIKDNVHICADGAFTMKDNPIYLKKVQTRVLEDAEFFGGGGIVGLSISSVVQKKCHKLGIDYIKVILEFIHYLNENGYPVLLIANAARINSRKSRNNDLMICDEIYQKIEEKSMVRWYHEEMAAEEIRAYIGKCRFLVGSRFHAMIGALEQKIPVLLVGWSHKYQEVLDMFQLGHYAIDFSKLDVEMLIDGFQKLLSDEIHIKSCIEKNYDAVIKSSFQNIELIKAVIDDRIRDRDKKDGLLYLDRPERYMGNYIACRKGYACQEEIRKNAASGGMVTAFLCYLLDAGKIDGAWVTKSSIEDGKLGYKTYIAVTKEEICEASSSIYMDMPLLGHLNQLEQFDGRLAVVLCPCMMEAFNRILEKDQSLKKKIVMKLGLYCSGNHSDKATLLSLEKSRIPLEGAERLYYRRGHWRGMSTVIYKDGRERNFPYTKTICTYKNAYFFEKNRCMFCQDHYANTADISFGDIWLKEMKKNPIKHTSCVIRNQKAMLLFEEAVNTGWIQADHISTREILKSQKRALVFKFNCAKAKKVFFDRQGLEVKLNTENPCRWNHKLAFYLAEKNRLFSINNYEKLKKIPLGILYYYMCLIRVLLSF